MKERLNAIPVIIKVIWVLYYFFLYCFSSYGCIVISFYFCFFFVFIANWTTRNIAIILPKTRVYIGAHNKGCVCVCVVTSFAIVCVQYLQLSQFECNRRFLGSDVFFFGCIVIPLLGRVMQVLHFSLVSDKNFHATYYHSHRLVCHFSFLNTVWFSFVLLHFETHTLNILNRLGSVDFSVCFFFFW